MKVSKIGWADFSGGPLNFVSGCTPISRGCDNCYARAMEERFGRKELHVTAHMLKLVELWSYKFPSSSPKRGLAHKPMAFVCNTSDLFHEDVPDEYVYLALRVMRERSDVNWQILTKRPARMAETLEAFYSIRANEPCSANIWLGTSVEDQRTANERIPALLRTPAAMRFVSVEPMLEPVSLFLAVASVQSGRALPRPDWVICGAESGGSRRPFHVAWAESLYEECRHYGIPFYGKQTSAYHAGKPLILPRYGEIKEWPHARFDAPHG